MKKRGIGLGSMFYGIGYGFNRPDIGAAHIEIAEDGSATVYTGVCDLGQGIQTLLAQIAGAELGLGMDEIRVMNADTGSTPDSGPTSGSRAITRPRVSPQGPAPTSATPTGFIGGDCSDRGASSSRVAFTGWPTPCRCAIPHGLRWSVADGRLRAGGVVRRRVRIDGGDGRGAFA